MSSWAGASVKELEGRFGCCRPNLSAPVGALCAQRVDALCAQRELTVVPKHKGLRTASHSVLQSPALMSSSAADRLRSIPENRTAASQEPGRESEL